MSTRGADPITGPTPGGAVGKGTNRAMRVLMLNASFSVGGYTHCLCNALADAGIDVELYTGPYFLRAQHNFARIAYQARIRFYRHTQLRSYRRGPMRPLWRALRLAGHLWSMTRLSLEARRFDVIHVQYFSVRDVDRWWLRAIAHVLPVVYTVHNLYPHDRPQSGAIHRLFRDIYVASDALIAHADATVRGLVERFGISREKIVKIPHGNANYLRDRRETRDMAQAVDGNQMPLVLLFGEMRYHKGIDVLIRAAAHLKNRAIRFRVLVAGTPSGDPGRYTDLVDQLGVGDCVEIRAGFVPDESVAAYFRAATVVALPYRTIDQSGVAVTALSLGRAVVATRIAGLEELVQGADAGVLVPVDDPSATADAVARLLTDETLRKRCEENGRRYADTALAWGPIARKTMGVYERVVAHRNT